MRFVGERRAVAAAVLAFFMLQYLLGGFLDPNLEELKWVLVSLGAAYTCAFVGVVAGWFWARWFSLGLAFSGLAMALIAAYQLGGLHPVLMIMGGSHLILGLALLGDKAAEFYDGRRDWRERFRMDENAVNRLGKAVMRAGASLPYLIIAGLMPKQGLADELTGLLALGFGVAGLVGVVRMRTWSVVAFAAAAGASVALVPEIGLTTAMEPIGAAILLVGAIAPFVRPAWRYLTVSHQD